MKIEQVKKLSPLERLCYWITERESIRLKRAKKLPAPWTDDEILQTYRFCNVRRMDDKVSVWLAENWYAPFHNHHNMLLACAIARFFNKPESLGAITHDVFTGGNASRQHFYPNWKTIKTKLRKLKESGPIFNGAYMVRGNDGIDKVECVIDYYVKPLMKIAIDDGSMEKTHANIVQSYGMGSFMVGQIVSDLRWAMDGAWADRNVWAPIGPGSLRGMNRLLERPLKQPMKQAEFTEELQNLIGEIQQRVDKSIWSRLEAIDAQSLCCELDKYNRVLEGEGKPKQLYRGVK